VVSVPDGAPPARDGQGNIIAVPADDEDVDPANDEKYRYVLNCRDRLTKIRRIVLAGDGDEPGWRLCQELARRLGKARCSFVTYPAGCKDANEVLVKHGPAEVMKLVTGAKPFPVRGLYRLSDCPDEGQIKTYSLGLAGLDYRPHQPKEPHLLIYRGAFIVASGLPGGGKTAWTTQAAFNMARNHGWKVAIASFEMRISPTLRDMLRGYHIGLPRKAWTKARIAEADAFIEEHFFFIALAPDDDESEADIDWVIDRAVDAVIRFNISMLIVDPWNELEHKRRPGETTADYTNRAIRSLKRFATSRDVATVVVAHPTKQAGVAAKAGEHVTLYDISDGATWANKAELGLIISRQSAADTITEVAIRKVKFRGTGRTGSAYLTYDEDLEQFVA
jgi:twinkle protein